MMFRPPNAETGRVAYSALSLTYCLLDFKGLSIEESGSKLGS